MTILISGRLKDAFDRPLANVNIKFGSLRTNLNTVVGTATQFKTGNDGSYSVEVATGSYSVEVDFGGSGFSRVGEIQILMDSLPGNLEKFLTIPGVDEITPEILAQVIQARYDAIEAAGNAASDATSIIMQQLQQQQSDFDSFLLSSGYVFLGDYENGPYTIAARNQIIRYQNEFWRLNAATNLPYITTGVNSTSWAADVTHLVSVGDATLRQQLATGTTGNGLSLIKTVPLNPYESGRSANDAIKDRVSIYDFTSDSLSDDTTRFQKAALAGVKNIYVPSRYGALRVGELTLTQPMNIYGEGCISIDRVGSRLTKISGAAFGIKFLGDINNRPHGGGLNFIDLRGENSADTGPLLMAQNWSYFINYMLGLQNNSDWGLVLKNVAEGGLDYYLCRRLGSESSGCIKFDDYDGIPNNNVNNYRLQNGTLGLNSGNWIYGTDNSNTDVIWIQYNKIEFDAAPISQNTTPKTVLYLGEAKKVFIDNNSFTNFKLSNPNLYENVIKFGANSRVSQNVSNNYFDGCDINLINIAGGSVAGSNNIVNQAGATAAGGILCTSNLPQGIDPLIFQSSNGAKNRRSVFRAEAFYSAHELHGAVNNPFVTDAAATNHYGTVMSVPANTEVRRATIPRGLVSDKEFVHITGRVKNVSGSSTAITLNLDGKVISAITVPAYSTWYNIVWQIRPNRISNGAIILTNGASALLFDGLFIEKKDYLDWSFAWSPGEIAAGATVTSPFQSVSDTTGFAVTTVEITANNTIGDLDLTRSLDPSGNLTVRAKNRTGSPITPVFTRINVRYSSAGRS